MLGFWMGKDSKVHSLGERGSTGGAGFAESGGRNWVHSAATVLAFLQKGRGLLKPGYKFRPLVQDDVLTNGVKVLTARGRQEKTLQLTADAARKDVQQPELTSEH